MSVTFNQQTFTATTTWTVPVAISGNVTAEVWAAGGSGGGRSTRGGGGGGGGGAFSKGTTALLANEVHSVFIGAPMSGGGGAAGSAGSSYFSTCAVVFARGGTHVRINIAIGGLGGLSAQGVGNLARWQGGSGGTSAATFSGGGGEGAGTTQNGRNASGSAGGQGTDGGDGATGRATVGIGDNGFIYGGGGAGAYRTTSQTYLGGYGASGAIRISWFTTDSEGGQYFMWATVDGDD